MSNTSKILLVCLKTATAEKSEYGGVVKKTSHPGFEIKVEFDESREKKTFKCPHCGREVGYKAFRYEFNLKRSLKWPLLSVGVGVVLFFASVFLGMGGLSMDQVKGFAIGGFMLFALGLIWLFVLGMVWFFFYREDKQRYIFRLLGPNHILLNWTRGGRWKTLEPKLP